MSNSRLLTAAAAALCLLAAHAQEIDLQQQRREDQTVNAVPGYKVDHHGMVLNPTPQSFKTNEEVAVSLAKPLKVKAKTGRKAAQKAGVKLLSGAYSLEITPKGANIVAFDNAGEYYARQTLAQLLGSERAKVTGSLPSVLINDYPELAVRGVVEGYYGEPWSHATRLALIDFFGRNKLNTYIYGPKNDPYHTSPNWRKPYPEAEAMNLNQLIDSCNAKAVNFVWAVHPGADIKWSDTDFADLMAKFEQLYSLGCRHFAIFFDDIHGEGTNAHKQVAFLNRLTKEFVEAKGDVSPLAMCPTDYTRAWADGSENGPLAIYGRDLDPSIMVMWTGDAVCGDIPRSTLQWVDERTKRPALVWWNYPVTDYARHILLQGPVYGLANENRADDLCGLVSNPMENGIASTLALYSVADYTWNPAAYNPLDSWERGLVYLMPECAEAYRSFAINSCDTEYGYRRSESWETPDADYETLTPQLAAVLLQQLRAMRKAPSVIRQKCTDSLLLKEIDPWLTQLEALAKRTHMAVLLASNPINDPAAFWLSFIENRMDSVAQAAYDAHKVGTLKWQPLYENLMDKMVDEYYQRLAARKSSIPNVIGSFGNMASPSRKKMFDNDTSTVFFADRVQQDGDYIGVDLAEVTPIHDVAIRQGRDANDPVIFPLCQIEYSVDGKEWLPLTEPLKNVRDIKWKATDGQNIEARYVRLLKLPKHRDQGVGIAEFAVNRAGISDAVDRNPQTFEHINGTKTFDVPSGSQEFFMLMANITEPVTIALLDADGNTLASYPVPAIFAQVGLEPGTAKIAVSGGVDLYEIIFR